MFIGRVMATVVSTCKEMNLVSQKLLVVEDVCDRTAKNSIIAIDTVGAGIGEIVLVVVDGGAARQAAESLEAPVNAAIVGILDYPEHFVGKDDSQQRTP